MLTKVLAATVVMTLAATSAQAQTHRRDARDLRHR
jgi:hypothetical protein